MRISKSAPATATAGGQIAWETTVANDGPSTATNVVVTDVLPAAVTVVSVTGTSASCTAGVPGNASQPTTCSFGSLASGANRTMTVVATINPGFTGSMHNDASVTSSTADPDTSDNTATVTTTVGASADLSVTVVDSPDPVLAGRTVTWTINVVNDGPSTATVVGFLDLLPRRGDLRLAEATSGSAACVHVTIPDDPPSHQVECDLGTIAPGAAPTTVVVKAVVKSGTLPGAILNTATVSSATTDPDGGDDSALATTQVNTSADLRMALTSDKDVYKASATIVYPATVTNAGPSDAQAPSVTVDLPSIKAAVYVFDTAGCTKTGQQLVCVQGNPLTAGGAWSFNVHLLVKGNKGVVATTASVASTTTDPVGGDNTVTRSVKIGK